MHNRIVLLLFFSLLVVAGIGLSGGTGPNPYFGIRTAETLGSPGQWRATNTVAGMHLMLVGWAGYFLLSPLRRIGPLRLVVLLSVSTALLLVPALLPAPMSTLYAWLTTHGIGGGVQAGQLLAPLVTLLLVGGVGNLLHREAIPRNPYLGFRLRAAMQDASSWQLANQAGGRLLHWLSAAGVLATCVMAAIGNTYAAFASSLAVLLIAPLAAYAAAAHRLRP